MTDKDIRILLEKNNKDLSNEEIAELVSFKDFNKSMNEIYNKLEELDKRKEYDSVEMK